MEQQVFVKPAVAEILGDNYIEARLHTDYPRFMKLEEDLLNTKSQPVFAVASPDQWENLANFDQEDFDPSQGRARGKTSRFHLRGIGCLGGDDQAGQRPLIVPHALNGQAQGWACPFFCRLKAGRRSGRSSPA